MSFTPQQQTAIVTHDRNLIIVAGAGSGKTRVLVERYLSLLNAHPDWPLTALVAITFTQEAAQEMRVRVRQTLENSLLQTSDAQAAQSLRERLAQMDTARIGTIHSLCATILRANAAEAALDPGFGVLDEVRARLLLAQAVEAVLAELAVDDPDDLLRLAQAYDERELVETLATPSLVAQDFSSVPNDTESLLDGWRSHWQALAERAVNTIRTAITERYHAPGTDGKALSQRWQDVHNAYEALTLPDATLDQQIDVLRGLAGISLHVGRVSEQRQTERDDLKYIVGVARELIERIYPGPGDDDARAADLLLAWVGMLRRVQARYVVLKQTESALDFDDLEKLTARLLREHPAVRERYRSGEFRHVLVDEFQDTNAAQWEIIQAIADVHQPGSLFVVGDPKQSIYGFRGADVSVFGQVRDQITHAQGQMVPLSRSFRSHRGLVNAFNALFAQIMQTDPASPVAAYQIAYDTPMDAHRDDLPQHATLNLLLVDSDAADDRGERLNAEQKRQWEAYEIGNRLNQMVAEGWPVQDKDSGQPRPMNYGDMALLFRSMTHVALYENVFKVLQIPYVTLAGRGFYDRQEIWDVLNVLRVLVNPADELALASALRSPLFAFSDDLLLLLRMWCPEADDAAVPASLWQALSKATREPGMPELESVHCAQISRAWDVLSALQQLAGRVTIAELLHHLLARTGYLAMLQSLPDGARRRRNVEKLLKIAEDSGLVTLAAFLPYIDSVQEADVREGEALLEAENAVRLMSIHRSKGLEFPVVCLVDAAASQHSRSTPLVMLDECYGMCCKLRDEETGAVAEKQSFAYRMAVDEQKQREEAESLRLLYVAATRARDMLLVSGTARKRKDGWSANGWLGLIVVAAGLLDEGDGALLPVPGAADALLHVAVPTYDPELPLRLQVGSAASPTLPIADPVAPPLMQVVGQPRRALIGHITASQLIDLYEADQAKEPQERRKYRQRLVSDSVDDSPVSAAPRTRPAKPRVTGRVIGNIVHEALRYWHLPETTPDLNTLLETYAWQQHLTDTTDIADAVSSARELLVRFEQSELCDWVRQSKARRFPVYHELPFMLRRTPRLIHGMIDLVFQRTSGEWLIVDYKTSYVPEGRQPQALARHMADHFTLQVGAYAEALTHQLGGHVPEVYVHYVRYNHAVRVPAAIWREKFAALDAVIDDVLGD